MPTPRQASWDRVVNAHSRGKGSEEGNRQAVIILCSIILLNCSIMILWKYSEKLQLLLLSLDLQNPAVCSNHPSSLPIYGELWFGKVVVFRKKKNRWLPTLIGLKKKKITQCAWHSKQEAKQLFAKSQYYALTTEIIFSAEYITPSQRRYVLNVPDVNLTSGWRQSD